MKYYLTYLPILAPFRLRPGFIRVEFNVEHQALFYTDLTVVNDLAHRASIDVDGVHFANPINAYCAILILDQALARAHVNSPAFDEEASKVWGQYGLPERASMGFTFDNYPHEAGFDSRYVIPVSIEDRLPLNQCILEHLAANYTNKPITEWLVGHTPIEAGFIGVATAATFYATLNSPLRNATPATELRARMEFNLERTLRLAAERDAPHTPPKPKRSGWLAWFRR